MNAFFTAAMILLAGTLAGCKPKAAASSDPIGPQFWLYDVSGYDRTRSDVVKGLGGRWISVRYEARSGTVADRAAKVAEITDAFAADGWTREKLPRHSYVLSHLYETGPDDLYFRRDARNDEPEHFSFANAIHVSADGRVICSYCEVGW